jgi:hypothetical protein
MEIHTNNPHKENPNPEDNPTLNTSPWAEESSRSHPEIPYVYLTRKLTLLGESLEHMLDR